MPKNENNPEDAGSHLDIESILSGPELKVGMVLNVKNIPVGGIEGIKYATEDQKLFIVGLGGHDPESADPTPSIEFLNRFQRGDIIAPFSLLSRIGSAHFMDLIKDDICAEINQLGLPPIIIEPIRPLALVLPAQGEWINEEMQVKVVKVIKPTDWQYRQRLAKIAEDLTIPAPPDYDFFSSTVEEIFRQFPNVTTCAAMPFMPNFKQLLPDNCRENINLSEALAISLAVIETNRLLLEKYKLNWGDQSSTVKADNYLITRKSDGQLMLLYSDYGSTRVDSTDIKMHREEKIGIINQFPLPFGDSVLDPLLRQLADLNSNRIQFFNQCAGLLSRYSRIVTKNGGIKPDGQILSKFVEDERERLLETMSLRERFINELKNNNHNHDFSSRVASTELFKNSPFEAADALLEFMYDISDRAEIPGDTFFSLSGIEPLEVRYLFENMSGLDFSTGTSSPEIISSLISEGIFKFLMRNPQNPDAIKPLVDILSGHDKDKVRNCIQSVVNFRENLPNTESLEKLLEAYPEYI